jgi:cytochrome bd-type quinol oxidase subunit 2
MNNAYIGPQNINIPKVRKAVIVAAVVAFIISITIFLTQQDFIKTQATDVNDNGAIILFIFSLVCLVIAFVVSLITKKQNNNGDE